MNLVTQAFLCKGNAKDNLIENSADKTYSQKIARACLCRKIREGKYGNKQEDPKGDEKQAHH